MLVTTEPEQTFLAHHFETLSKDPTRDPRQQFRQPVGSAADGSGSGDSFGAGVVGPMGGSSSLSLPSVKAAMAESEGEDVSSRILRATAGAGVLPRRVRYCANLPPPTHIWLFLLTARTRGRVCPTVSQTLLYRPFRRQLLGPQSVQQLADQPRPRQLERMAELNTKFYRTFSKVYSQIETRLRMPALVPVL